MNKTTGIVSAVLAATILLSVPASAATVLNSDNFSKGQESEWVTDLYEPEEWDTSTGQLYLSVGRSGNRANRPSDKQDKLYSNQGRKLALDQPSSNTWTATIKMNITEEWMSASTNRRRTEFRLDLADASGTPLADSPAIALINSSGALSMNIYNPKGGTKTGWVTVKDFINGDRAKEDLSIEEGWHNLYIKCADGVITYYYDRVKLGNCTLDEKDVYPTFAALNVYNYERPYVAVYDNFTFYDGAVAPAPLISSEKKDEIEDKRAETYSKKRSDWVSRYTKDGVLTKDIPDRYWDY